MDRIVVTGGATLSGEVRLDGIPEPSATREVLDVAAPEKAFLEGFQAVATQQNVDVRRRPLVAKGIESQSADDGVRNLELGEAVYQALERQVNV